MARIAGVNIPNEKRIEKNLIVSVSYSNDAYNDIISFGYADLR